jgi:hypothetical protein
LAAQGALGELPCITTNVFTEFIMNTLAIDNKLLRLSDIDFNFVATNSGAAKERNAQVPDRALVRYKMNEIIVRLSMD